MASRKAKPRERSSAPPPGLDGTEGEPPQPSPQPSSPSIAPPPAPTMRMLDDLAQTLEAPAPPRLLIMDTAESVIADVGFAAATEREIARRAEMSLDEFHAHFASKQALLRALAERLSDQAALLTEAAAREHRASSSPLAVLEASVRSLLELVVGRAPLVRAFLESGDRALVADLRSAGMKVASRVVSLVEETASDEKPAPEDVAFAVLLAVSFAHHAVVAGTDRLGAELDRLDRKEIGDRVALAVVSYLEARRTPSRSVS